MASVTGKTQDAVHHMLHDSRPGQISALRHMGNDENRDAAGLADPHEFIPAGAHLRDASRSRFQIGAVHGLYRVHNEEHRLQALAYSADIFDVRLSQNKQIVADPRRPADSVGPHPDLLLGFLPGNIKDNAP